MAERELRATQALVKRELALRSGGRCELCGRSSEFLEVHHIVPLSRGGSTELDNLQLVCASCNARTARGAQTIEQLKPELTANYALERRAVDLLIGAGFGVMSDVSGPDGAVDVVARRAMPRDAALELLLELKSGSGALESSDVASFAAKVGQHGNLFGVILTERRPTAAALSLAQEFALRVVNFGEFTHLIDQLLGASDE